MKMLQQDAALTRVLCFDARSIVFSSHIEFFKVLWQQNMPWAIFIEFFFRFPVTLLYGTGGFKITAHDRKTLQKAKTDNPH